MSEDTGKPGFWKRNRLRIVIGALVLIILFLVLNPLTLLRMHLRVEDNLGIKVGNELFLTADVQEGLRIQILDQLNTNIKVNDSLQIPLNETFDVPLNLNVDVPLNTEIVMNDTLSLTFDLPVDVWLDDKQLVLKDLKIPFNEALYIEDELDLKIDIPLDTKIKTNFKGFPNIPLPVKGNIPVDIKVPIAQTLQVNDTLVLNPEDYNVNLKTIIPVSAEVPINQGISVTGSIMVPLNETIQVPLNKTINAPVLNVFNADVAVTNDLPVRFNNTLKANAVIEDTLRVNMEELKIDPSTVKIRLK